MLMQWERELNCVDAMGIRTKLCDRDNARDVLVLTTLLMKKIELCCESASTTILNLSSLDFLSRSFALIVPSSHSVLFFFIAMGIHG